MGRLPAAIDPSEGSGKPESGERDQSDVSWSAQGNWSG